MSWLAKEVHYYWHYQTQPQRSTSTVALKIKVAGFGVGFFFFWRMIAFLWNCKGTIFFFFLRHTQNWDLWRESCLWLEKVYLLVRKQKKCQVGATEKRALLVNQMGISQLRWSRPYLRKMLMKTRQAVLFTQKCNILSSLNIWSLLCGMGLPGNYFRAWIMIISFMRGMSVCRG